MGMGRGNLKLSTGAQSLPKFAKLGERGALRVYTCAADCVNTGFQL